MALYTNSIPSNPKNGDIITLNTSGSYVLPKRLGLKIEAVGAPGGTGQHVRYFYGSGGTTHYVFAVGGPGGLGGLATFERTLAAGTVLKAEIGAVGTEQAYIVHAPLQATSTTGKAGGDGGATKLSIDGVAIVTCEGGKGGKGAYVYQSVNNSPPQTTTPGATGANGTVSLKPSDATTGIGSPAGIIITVLSTNSQPSDPKDIQYGNLFANRPVEVTWTPSIDPEGDAVTYILEYRYDSTTWTQVAIVQEPKATVTIPALGSTGQFRVKASDSYGDESGYVTGPVKPINYNNNPIVSGEDRDLGEVRKPFELEFHVDDPDAGDILRAVVKLNDKTLMEIQNAERLKSYSLPQETLSELWIYLPVGRHNLTIEAYDDKGGSAKRTITFARICPDLELETLNGVETDELVKTAMFYFSANIPSDAEFILQARNSSGADYEDITAYNYNSRLFRFANTTKYETGKARLDVRVVVNNGPSGGNIYFYGGTILLDASNDDSLFLADGVRIEPGMITPGGALTSSDTDVMRALNTLSLTTGGGGVGEGSQNHAQLFNRDAIDQHPISAISGLEQRLVTSETAISDLSQAIPTSYAELASKKAAGQLIPGQRYVITDYATKYQQPVSNKIVTCDVEPLTVTAETVNQFSPVAFSAAFPMDVIYYNFDDNKCEDNSTARTGFILRRHDTVRRINMPHDWRFMKWARFLVDTSAMATWEDGAAVTKGTFYITGTSISKALRDGIPTSATDGSYFVEVVQEYATNYFLYNTAYGLTKSSEYAEYYTFDLNGSNDHARTTITNILIDGSADGYRSLANNLWRYKVVGGRPYSISAAGRFENNSFGSDHHSSAFGSNSSNNVLGSNCNHCTFGASFNNNIFAQDCYNITFGSTCYGNIFGQGNSGIAFGPSCYNNIFATGCSYNTFGANCHNNVFGAHSTANRLGTNCNNNTFARFFRYNELVSGINGKDFSAIAELHNKTYNHTISMRSDGKAVISWLDATNTTQFIVM